MPGNMREPTSKLMADEAKKGQSTKAEEQTTKKEDSVAKAAIDNSEEKKPAQAKKPAVPTVTNDDDDKDKGKGEETSPEAAKQQSTDATEGTEEDNHTEEDDHSPAAQEPASEHNNEVDGPLLLKRGAIGHVDWFSRSNGYGFIIEEGAAKGERLFVHCDSILKFVPTFSCELHQGDQVEFDVIKSVKGKEAVAITGIGGQRIGSRRFFPRSSSRGTRFRGTSLGAVVRSRPDDSTYHVANETRKLSIHGTDKKKDSKSMTKAAADGGKMATAEGRERKASAGRKRRSRSKRGSVAVSNSVEAEVK